MPDTQYYSESFPAIFTSQTQWIIDNKAARNIVFVTHEGDIVNQNTTTQWQRANTSLSMLDGVVPYGMGPGNHDQPTTMFNQYFPYTRYQSEPWYGGHYPEPERQQLPVVLWRRAGLRDRPSRVLPARGEPSHGPIRVFKSYPDRIGIMTTHGYLNESAQRTVHGCTSTQYLWDGLAVPNPNLHFMLSGHVHDESRRTDVANGHPVFQMLADYQDRAERRRRLAADPAIRAGREQDLRADLLAVAEPLRNRRQQRVHARLSRWAARSTTLETIDGRERVGRCSSRRRRSSTTRTYEWKVTVDQHAAARAARARCWTFTTAPDGSINRSPVAARPVTQHAGRRIGGHHAECVRRRRRRISTYTIVTGPTHGTLTGTPPPWSTSRPRTTAVRTASRSVRTTAMRTATPRPCPSRCSQSTIRRIATANPTSVQAGSTLSVTCSGSARQR